MDVSKHGELIIKIKPQKDLNLYTFLMPSVSVGNVGQLAVDIVICTLNAKKIGSLYHPALLPIVGYNPYDMKSHDIATASDLYISELKQIIILQMRSPLLTEGKESFLHELGEWLKSCAFDHVVMLGSCHAHLRRDKQITGAQIRYLSNQNDHPLVRRLQENDVLELEEHEDEFGVLKREVPGAGFMYDLLNTCPVSTIALLVFADEGDNRGDALRLLSEPVGHLLPQIKESIGLWKLPISWTNLFGAAPPPPLIY